MEEPGTPAGAIRLEFTGRAGEYFRIWIVNVFLTVITLGIYSAWAKVRRNRYLYSSVRLAGATFEYLANPVQILKGRVIAVGLLAAYSAAGHVSDELQGALTLVFVGFLPWLVIRARRFALRNTAWRNIRFDFTSGYGEAAGIFILWPMLIGMSLGLMYPLYVWRRAKFMIANSAFGSHAFSFEAGKGGFFLIYVKFVLLLTVVLIGGGMAVAAMLKGPADPAIGMAVAALLVTALALLATLSYVHVAVTNRTWSGIEIGGMAIRCELKVARMYWIALTSLAAIVLTFGLLVPWATIRMLRYRVEHLSLLNADQLEALVGAQSAQIGAAGEEVSDLLGVDIAV